MSRYPATNVTIPSNQCHDTQQPMSRYPATNVTCYEPTSRYKLKLINLIKKTTQLKLLDFEMCTNLTSLTLDTARIDVYLLGGIKNVCMFREHVPKT